MDQKTRRGSRRRGDRFPEGELMRLPPHSVEAEQAVLGALLLDAPFGHLWAKSEAFQPIDQQWQVRQAEPLAVTPGSWDQPIEVTLRLEKSSLQAGKECLWRISPELISTFLEWVGHAPDDQICQLE